MPLIRCPDCGTDVSTAAKACPTCGASARTIAKGQPPKQIGRRGKVIIAIVTAALVGGGGLSVLHRAGQNPSPADRAAEARHHQRLDIAVTDAANLKAATRDPDSLLFEQILANEDGSIICMRYRARNGFGGVNHEHVVFTDGSGTTTASAWSRHCAHVTLDNITNETVSTLNVVVR